MFGAKVCGHLLKVADLAISIEDVTSFEVTSNIVVGSKICIINHCAGRKSLMMFLLKTKICKKSLKSFCATDLTNPPTEKETLYLQMAKESVAITFLPLFDSCYG